MEEKSSVIIPQRIIPFDIGTELSPSLISIIETLLSREYEILEIPSLMLSISKDITCKAKINQYITLYVFSYGVGVFVVEDKPYEMVDRYPIGYCEYRKNAHKEILEFTREGVSDVINDVIEKVRGAARNNVKFVRSSSNETWEHHGLSYVMTISYLVQEDFIKDYKNFSDEEKKDLQIMLQPSLAKKEDSMVIEYKEDSFRNFDPYNFDINNMEEPIDWIKSEDCSIYISWAAVIVYMKDISNNIMQLIECLEADLQAMWFYTYCLNANLKNTFIDSKNGLLDLKKEKYNYQRKYNKFKNENDSSIPAYVSEVRSEIIRTSGVDNEKKNYLEYLNFCIDETVSRETERQKKYSRMSEILLFIIAFIQIAPMAYQFMIGEYTNLKIVPVIVLLITVIVGMWLIIRKD